MSFENVFWNSGHSAPPSFCSWKGPMLQWRESGSWTFRHMILQGSKALLLFDGFFSLFKKTYPALKTHQFHEFFPRSHYLSIISLYPDAFWQKKQNWYLVGFFCGKECLYSKIVRKWVPIMCAGSLQKYMMYIVCKRAVVVIVCM